MNSIFFLQQCFIALITKKSLRNTFFIAIVLLGVVGGFSGYYFRFHLLWKYSEWRFALQASRTIPSSSMTTVEITNDWLECSFDTLCFYLPSELAVSEVTTKKKDDTIVFQNDNNTIIVTLVHLDAQSQALLNLASSYMPNPEKILTLPRLRFECSRAGADVFSWAMNPRQVSQNTFLVNLRQLLLAGNIKKVETFFHDDVDRIVLFYEGRAVIDWQDTTGSNAGYMHIIDHNKDEENLFKLTQKICQSMRVVAQPVSSDLKSPSSDMNSGKTK